MARPHARMLAAAVVALSLAGCGEPAARSLPGVTLKVRLDEYRITPQNVRLALGGRALRIVAVNRGRLTHNVKIQSETRTDAEGTPLILGGTASAKPGQVVTAEVRLPPGRYRMVCTIGNHDVLGQYGTLTVTRRR